MIRLISLFLLLLSGCSDDHDIKVYRLAKDEEQSGPLRWATPLGWEEQAAQGMRTGSFLVKGENGQEVDVSIIFMSGAAGGDLPNVNRWREQIALGPWSEKELNQNMEKVDASLGLAKIVDFANEEERIVVAYVPNGNGTWFFKMKGDRELVKVQKPVFVNFVKSVRANS